MSVGILTDSSFGSSRTVSFSNFQEPELETLEEENRGDMFQEHQKNSLLVATESDMNSRVSNILVVLASAKFNIAYLVLSAIGFVASFPEYHQVRGLRLVCYALALLDIYVFVIEPWEMFCRLCNKIGILLRKPLSLGRSSRVHLCYDRLRSLS